MKEWLVPRPAYKLWKYLESLGRIGGWIAPRLDTLATRFGRSVITIKRWLGELFRAGILSSKRRGPHPPLYTILIPTSDTCRRRGPYMSTENEPTEYPPTPPSSFLPEPAKPGESYSDFSKAVEEAQLPASAVDHERARRFFFELPLEERKAAILGLKLRIASGEFENPIFRPRPDNYLRNRVWERPVREKRKRHTWREKIEATNQRVKQWAQEMDRWIAQRKQERAAQTI